MNDALPDRFLHVCYNCDESQLDAVVAFFTTSLAMHEVMRSPSATTSGSLLGIEGPITSSASFLYDARGPRRSPALEIQGWRHPSVYATPLQHSHQVGIHAIGFAKGNAEGVAGHIRHLDRNRGSWPRDLDIGRSVVRARDPYGVAIDIVATESLVDGADRGDDALTFTYVRIHCTSLATSLDWYQRFGFAVLCRNAPGDVTQWAQLSLGQLDLAVLLIEVDQQIDTHAAPSAANHAGLFRCATRVQDLAQSIAELQRRDISVVSGPSAVAISGTSLPELLIAIVRDPDGVPFELVQRPVSAFG